ncbi:MAG TPA: ELWxxDGT repeat protein, partial [Thermoanaerobaculia bacterium]|nr:ELWxxDGT repeat protein [Thermoanaerobaculia bacterium]
TQLVKDIYPGTAPAFFNGNLDSAVVNGVAYFPENDGVHGVELWTSDGTAAGTVMVKDIWPGSVSSDPLELRALFGRLYFQATDGPNGRELWTSDGTAAGTFMVCDVAPGRDSSGPSGMIAVGDRIYFAATTSETGNELWSVDRVLDNPAGLRRRAVHP